VISRGFFSRVLSPLSRDFFKGPKWSLLGILSMAFFLWYSLYDTLSRVPSPVSRGFSPGPEVSLYLFLFMLALFLIINLAMFLQFRRKVHSKCRKRGAKKRMLLSSRKLWQKLSKQIPT
jgi:hypothetical protein